MNTQWNAVAQAVLPCAVSFAATVVLGYFLIPVLRRLKAGQRILEDGPKWHMTKQGTPTMGGLMFIGGMLFTLLLWGATVLPKGEYSQLYIFLFALLFGAIGFLDDYEKVKKKQNLGLTARQKLVLQIAAAVLFLSLMRREGLLSPTLYIPVLEVAVVMNWVPYTILSVFIIVGTVNAVNLTDGLDGLASSVTLPVALFFTLLPALWAGESFGAVGSFAAALTGGLLGFLVYNHYPAKVFMGDTGSLFLGGAVAALAFAYNMPLVLVPVGIVYIAEAMSDIIQVGYFKLSGGKRVFRMAPLHHHFELGGWRETKVVRVFTLVSALSCLAALWAVSGRY